MQYNPSEVKERTLTPEGKYTFTVVGIEETLTKTGKPQFKLSLNCDEGVIYDYKLHEFMEGVYSVFGVTNKDDLMGRIAQLDVKHIDGYAKVQFPVPPLEAGKYRIRIEEATEETSKNTGKGMIKLKLKVSGTNRFLFKYLVEGEWFATSVKSVCDSFNIAEPKGPINPFEWVGKVGGAVVKQQFRDGVKEASISYFIKPEGLAPWSEKETITQTAGVDVDDSIPF